MQTIFLGLLSKVKNNWQSGLTVSLVSIPLSVSLAVASNSTPTAGIITAIWAGFMASIFGGSKYNIVGPTGALSGILASYALMHGADTLSMLAIISAVFIFISYIFKLEKYLVFIPASTVHGFTLGVAFIIGLNQMNFALGISGLEKHPEFIKNILETISHISQTSVPTLALFIIFLVGLFSLLKLTPKLPGAITLTPIGIVIGYLSVARKIPFEFKTLGMQYADIAPKVFEPVKFFFDSSLLLPALTVAVVAILETMISAKIADGMTGTKHQPRKEMFGLSIANAVSGLMGGIPATAALARTSLNVKTGANDKMSATISSVCIVLISFVFLTYFKYIPLAVIAAILVFVAVRMVEIVHFYRMFSFDKKSFGISLLVAFVTIYEDPIIGILFGTAISLLLFVEKISKGQFELMINNAEKKMTDHVVGEDIDDENICNNCHTLVYSIKGQLAYVNAQAHISRFETKLNAEYENVVLRMRELFFIDLDGVDAFEEIVNLIESQGKQVLLTGVNPLIEKSLEESKSFQRIRDTKRIFPHTKQALEKLGYSL
ncbi:MAG: SulP family inorganic anion transporter [Minisyncoccota bacterium]